jgi:hypothetical protein
MEKSHREALKQIRELEQLDLSLASESYVTDKLTALATNQYGMFGLPNYGPEHVWYRAQICDSAAFPNLRRMIYAPPDKARMGRANMDGQSTHYACWNLQGALSEVHAVAGDLVQVVAIRSTGAKQVKCVVIGELAYLMQAGRSLVNSKGLSESLANLLARTDPTLALYWHLVDAFFASSFRKDVPRGAPNHEYLLSACLAKKIHAAEGAVLFPSVRTFGAMNIALPASLFDTCFEVIYTQTFRVIDQYRQNVYLMRPELYSEDFELNGSVNWSFQLTPRFSGGPLGSIRIPPQHKGWRVPPSAKTESNQGSVNSAPRS